MDIGSRENGPAGILSNFSPNSFWFDGVFCASMEGLLQSFKYEELGEQQEVCALVGIVAKRRGLLRDADWKASQTLWWKGKVYQRSGQDYQDLLKRAFGALAINQVFREALLSTGEEVLIHSVGKKEITDTILTEEEFCAILQELRKKLREESVGGA